MTTGDTFPGFDQRAAGAFRDALREASALLDAGRFDHAARSLSQLRKASPDHPDVFHLSGLLALHLGKTGQAEKLIRMAIAQAPEQAFYYVNLANTLRRQNRQADAFSAYQKSITLNPSFHGAYLNRGTFYADLERYDEAMEDFETFISLMPAHPAGYAELGETARRKGDFPAMLQAYERGRQALPDHVPFLTGLASACERLSDMDRAEHYAQCALEKLPEHPGVLGIWSRIKRRKGALEEARTRLEQSDPERYQGSAARILYAELGQVYDHLGLSGPAYRCFKRQNDLAAHIAREAGIKKSTYLAQLDALDAYESQPRAFPVSSGSCDTPGHKGYPVFLVGFPRSGTTLLDQILDSHPDIHVIEEQPVLLRVRNALEARPGGYPCALCGLDPEDRKQMRSLYWSALQETGADPGTHIVINKLPLNIIHTGLIRHIFPDARIIFALRDPCDAVLSCFMQDFQLNAAMTSFLSLADAATLYDRVMTIWLRHAEAVKSRVVTVRYENLVVNLKKETEPVLAHLGLAWDDSIYGHVTHARTRGSIRTPSYAQVMEPLHEKAAGRWHRYEAYLKPYLPVLEPYRRRFGYC